MPRPAARATGQWPEGAAFIDSAYVPISEAKISVLDWGFTRSDVCYDVVHVRDGAFFRLEDHIRRFEASMEGLRMSVAHTDEEMKAVLAECVRLAGHRDSYVAMVCTRGLPPSGPRGSASRHVNRFIAYALPWIDVLPTDIQERGGHVIIAKTPRIPPDSVDPTIKNYHRGDMVKAMFEAEDVGADTAILLDHDGYITEGPGFNVFVVRDGVVTTPDRGALEGITRKVTLELCRDVGIQANADRLRVGDLHEADEIFLTTTAGGIIPVTRVDGRILSNDSPGPVSQQLKDVYWARHAEGWMVTPVDYSEPGA
ncbi:MAG: branched-chain amino acid--2-keto-4-methylthiobutyrate aminotransferase [Rhodospirillaceae bacterium]|nr:branched-chain amino acid--2-keto-4-methylthiobutyrate aminotransferase [Rhodospirillaceae bacterium]